MKRKISFFLAFCFLLSGISGVNAHWADADVKYLVDKGVIASNDAILQKLDAPITRLEMVTVIVKLLGGEDPASGTQYFNDIPKDSGDAYFYTAKASKNGYINGFADNTFRPNATMTRQDFFTVIGRAYELSGTATKEFSDKTEIAAYSKPYIDALQSAGLAGGYADGSIRPHGKITVAEALTVLKRVDVYHEAQKEEEKETETKPVEKPVTPPSHGGGGGGGGFTGPVISTDRTVPEINYTLSSTTETTEPVVISLEIWDNRSIKNKGWFFMRGFNIASNETKKAFAIYDDCIDFKQLFYNMSQYDNLCGGKGSSCILLNYEEARNNIEGVQFQEIENNKIVAKENGNYYVYAEDYTGNLTVVQIDIDNVKPPSATLSVQVKDDFSGESVADVVANVTTNPNTPIKEMFIAKDYDYFDGYCGGRPCYGQTKNKRIQDVANLLERNSWNIKEKDGKFAVPDFGKYVFYILDENGNWNTVPLEVLPPESSDKTAPTLSVTLSPEGGLTYPITATVNASDDVKLARVSWVKVSRDIFMMKDKLYFFANVYNRHILDSNTFEITTNEMYAVCAMDTSGNCTCKFVADGKNYLD